MAGSAVLPSLRLSEKENPKMRVLISAPYFQPVVGRYQKLFSDRGIELVVPEVHERLSEDELLKLVDDIDGVICGDDAFTERVLIKAKKLRVISKWGTGIDSIDKTAAQKLGIKVHNTPDAFSGPVADTVLGYILAFARGLVAMDRDLRSAGWKKFLARSLPECLLGVIGVGNVGKEVIRRARACGMAVLGNDIATIPEDFVQQTGVKMVEKERIYREADFISINCDLNPTSFRLLSDPQFQQMKSTAYVINTARGPIIDEPALIRALQSGHIAGAALDVFEVEPLPRNSPLLTMNNVLLAPHNANASPRAWEQVHENTLRNLFNGLGLSVDL